MFMISIVCNNNSQFMVYCYLCITRQIKRPLFVFHKPRFLISQAHFLNAVFFKFIKCFFNYVFDLFFSSIRFILVYLFYILRNYSFYFMFFTFIQLIVTAAVSKMLILNFVYFNAFS